MPINVLIPVQIRKLADNQETLTVSANTIDGMLSELESRYPGFSRRLLDDQGILRKFVAVYVNDEDIRFLQNQQTPLKEGDQVSIIPAIAGG